MKDDRSIIAHLVVFIGKSVIDDHPGCEVLLMLSDPFPPVIVGIVKL
jgi:hypothetical protein